jgi:serine protease Do
MKLFNRVNKNMESESTQNQSQNQEEIKIKEPKKETIKPEKRENFLRYLIIIALIASFFGFLAGIGSGYFVYSDLKNYIQKSNNINVTKGDNVYTPQTNQEEAVINAVNQASPAVVSVIISKNLPVLEQYWQEIGPFQIPGYRQNGTKLQEVGGGSGFIISSDGMILTNKHVAADDTAEYTVLTNDGKRYPATVLARDPVQDLAILKINGNNFPVVKLGDSSNLQIGQYVITIGNALGEFRNTVSSGVISGLGRQITAGSGDYSETLYDVIQTDAAINPGNSGGPLLNLKGEVIGINTAIVSGAENISFAIPINQAKKDIEQIKSSGKIVYPFLGVCSISINEQIQQDLNLPVSYGALIKTGTSCTVAVSLGSPAEKAGLKEEDIILEINSEKITSDNSLAKIIQKYNPGDKITLKILRAGQEKNIDVTLGERKE